MINRAVLQQAFDILDYLQGRGIKALIAGGCARDLFFGVKPKDVDIVVVDYSLRDTAQALAEANIACRVHGFYNGPASDRIVGCVKLEGVDIDVVVYDCHEVSDAVESFDFNLNQFAIVGTRHGIEGAYVRFMGTEHWGRLRPVRQDCTPERAQRMLEKYLDLVPRRASAELPDEVPVGGAHGLF